MRLSVLLPTRNGGRFLRNCVASVLAQDDPSLELVVSDNANEDETPEVLREFAGDERLKIVRLDEPVPVTANWNAAFRAATGDYCLMMGDDDYLLPGCSQALRQALSRTDQPECLLYNAVSYVFPDAISGLDTSYYGDPHYRYGPEFAETMELTPGQKQGIVEDMFRFRPRIPLNMQTTLVSRRALMALGEAPFRPPFPDHFALNALLLRAKRWVYSPIKPLVVGVSLKSFGHFVYSQDQDAGLRYLGIETEFQGRLPGNELLSAMHIWLDTLKAEFPQELAGVEISRGDYVARQMHAWYLAYRFGAVSVTEAFGRLRLLSPHDWAQAARALASLPNASRALRAVRARRKGRAQELWSGLTPLPGVSDISEFAAWFDSRIDVHAANSES